MKLRNLMYATMIACAFASCSKDDENIPTTDGGEEEATATLEVQIAAPATKALPDGTKAQEDVINNLQLFVFNAPAAADDVTDNTKWTLETIGTADGSAAAVGNSKKSVKTVAIKPGNKKVVVLANTNITGIATYAELLAKTVDFSNEVPATTTTGLTMNSKTYDITVVASKVNFMGYGALTNTDAANYVPNAAETVKLYRNVAKISLNSVALKLNNESQYKNAELTLKNAFILHAHTNTSVVGAAGAEWGTTNQTGAYLYGKNTGVATMDYAAWVTYMENGTEKPFAWVYPYIGVEGDYPAVAADTYKYFQTLTGSAIGVNDDKPLFYVYENTEANKKEGDYNTLLVVQADFSYTGKGSKGQDSLYVEAGRYYPIAIGYGANEGDLTFDPELNTDLISSKAGVIRNLAYKINLTIAGPGYKTPFGPKPDGDGGDGGDTFLDAQIEVVAFGNVTQNETVE